jgi:homeobox protein cut-like
MQKPMLPDFPRSLSEGPVLSSSLRFGQDSTAGLLDRPPPMLDPLALHRKLLSQKMGPGSPSLGGGPGGPPAHSLYEMAALTHEMDTQAVTTKVKEILLANNVGQKVNPLKLHQPLDLQDDQESAIVLQLFGEHVLGLSQGSVSELLSKPKPWHMLSIKGREPFIRMQLWLNDPTSIDKLQVVKREIKENGGKRKRSFPGGPGSGMGDSGSDRSSPANAADVGDPYSGQSVDSPGSSSAKKPRVYFTDEQKEALRIAFALDPYPSSSSMEFLSQELGLEIRSISNWFHNHRMRLKQQLPHGIDNLALLANREGQSAFDPVKFRLLLHQRMLEMQAPEEAAANSSSVTSLLRQYTSLVQSNPGSPGGVLPTSGGHSGLDLSYKRDDDCEDKDSIAESRSDNDDSNLASSVHKMDELSDEPTSRPMLPISSSSSSRSRRKPAAPQWVRPEWMELEGSTKHLEQANSADSASAKDSGLTINGVCVMNSYPGAFQAKPESTEATTTNEGSSNNGGPTHHSAEEDPSEGISS